MPFNVALTILKCGLYILILNIIHIILITVITLGQMQKK
ncbi:putative membrane protein [Escherichia coli 6-319-05_S1_C1]|nr:putative membrane protein [Escherichia coli 6-319-05_S1_C2]KEM21456.1 putative membrane protein [Escherichia coli 6-319-05_S1_C3]KEM96141.1 putative membrane protein [Escherichia coli 6-319-05_S1_C1]